MQNEVETGSVTLEKQNNDNRYGNATDKFQSEKLTWPIGSGELNTPQTCLTSNTNNLHFLCSITDNSVLPVHLIL